MSATRTRPLVRMVDSASRCWSAAWAVRMSVSRPPAFSSQIAISSLTARWRVFRVSAAVRSHVVGHAWTRTPAPRRTMPSGSTCLASRSRMTVSLRGQMGSAILQVSRRQEQPRRGGQQPGRALGRHLLQPQWTRHLSTAFPGGSSRSPPRHRDRRVVPPRRGGGAAALGLLRHLLLRRRRWIALPLAVTALLLGIHRGGGALANTWRPSGAEDRVRLREARNELHGAPLADTLAYRAVQLAGLSPKKALPRRSGGSAHRLEAVSRVQPDGAPRVCGRAIPLPPDPPGLGGRAAHPILRMLEVGAMRPTAGWGSVRSSWARTRGADQDRGLAARFRADRGGLSITAPGGTQQSRRLDYQQPTTLGPGLLFRPVRAAGAGEAIARARDRIPGVAWHARLAGDGDLLLPAAPGRVACAASAGSRAPVRRWAGCSAYPLLDPAVFQSECWGRCRPRRSAAWWGW